MAKRKFKKEVVVARKQPPTKSYPLKQRLKVSGKWKEKGVNLFESTVSLHLFHLFYLSYCSFILIITR
jgi:hypothetical protein